jgi:tetratricopeptide (TPR) repeat protein
MLRLAVTAALLLQILLAPLSARAATSCRDAALAGNPEAERICSDAIAAMSYEAEPTAAERTALAAAHNNRAMARIAAGKLDDAAADLDEAASLSGEHWAIYLNRGNLHLAANEPGPALAAYQRARALAPQDTAAILANSVLAYRAMGELGQAEQALVQSGELTPAPAARRRAEPEHPPR